MSNSQNNKDLSDERLRKLANRNDVIAAMAQEILGLRHALSGVLLTIELLDDTLNTVVQSQIDDDELLLCRSRASNGWMQTGCI